MISLDKFINKYVGKSVGVPWGYDGECVSLVQVYLKECFGEPYIARGNGRDIGNTLVKAGVAKYVKTPQRGDIIVWGEPLGKIGKDYFGHVAIYMDGLSMFDKTIIA